MNILKNLILFGIIWFCFNNMSVAQTGSVEIIATGFENNDGQALIKIYNGSEGFPDEDKKAYKLLKAKITNRSCSLKISGLPYDYYAISITHDVNKNGVIDKNWLGFPKEPIGLSNYPKISKPVFEKAKFKVSKQDNIIRIVVKSIF